MTPDTMSEAQAVDSMTHAMLSSSMLLAFTEAVYSERREKVTIGQFYDGFMQTHQSQRFRPFNEGVILGILYWVMFMKENWGALVPEDPLSTWGVTPVSMAIPSQPNPTIKYFTRRLRNAMGHSAPDITVPQGTTPADHLEKVTITFHDQNMRDSGDTCDVVVTLKDAFTLTHKLHAIVLADVARRHGVAPPLAGEPGSSPV